MPLRLWGPGKCRSGKTFPSSPPVFPLLPLYCSLSLPKGGRANQWKTPIQTFRMDISLRIIARFPPVLHSVQSFSPSKINSSIKLKPCLYEDQVLQSI